MYMCRLIKSEPRVPTSTHMQNWLDCPILKATNNYYLLIILTTLNSEESSEGSGIVPGSLRSSSNVNLLIL